VGQCLATIVNRVTPRGIYLDRGEKRMRDDDGIQTATWSSPWPDRHHVHGRQELRICAGKGNEKA
jgi:hypothetical protein